MQEIWIFGDSFSDRNYTGSDTNYTWPRELEKKYLVRNFSKSGSGPAWQLAKLLKSISEVPENYCNDVILIFFVSEMFRLDLDFLNPGDQTLMYNFLTNNNNIKNDLFNEKKTQYKEYITFIKQLWLHYLSTDSFKQTELIKTVGALSILSSKFKKTLVWPCFDEFVTDINNNTTCYIIDFDLVNLEKTDYDYKNDPRINHLRKENHKTMFTQLCNWIENDITITESHFVRF